MKGDAHGGPQGRNEIATPVRAWFWRFGFLGERRRWDRNSCRPFGPRSRFDNLRSTASRPWLVHTGPSGLPLTLFLLLAASCILPRVLSQNQPAQPQAQSSPSPSPAPSPSPSPTPPPNLHQWGAVTSFHGLPSDRTHAIAQTEFGVTWFATDGGLARYDGRRTNAINADGLPPGRILALKVDGFGALWIGTENGAARLANGKFTPIRETAGKVITAIITPQHDRAIMSSESGEIFD